VSSGFLFVTPRELAALALLGWRASRRACFRSAYRRHVPQSDTDRVRRIRRGVRDGHPPQRGPLAGTPQPSPVLFLVTAVEQCNWISMSAPPKHARRISRQRRRYWQHCDPVRGTEWDGKRIVVVGHYDMPPATLQTGNRSTAGVSWNAKHMTFMVVCCGTARPSSKPTRPCRVP